MKKNIAIEASRLSKKYEVGYRSLNPVFRDVLSNIALAPLRILTRKRRKKKSCIWALRNINFEIKRGEVIGVIGRNGAGKSTLLKVLSRITEPTGGTVKLRGRVGSLIEVGTGFHQELTGRENIYLNGAILGMKKKEVDQKFSEIRKFSGIGKYLDTPVKRYSSGMYVRLAFSVAAHLDTEILLVDEVLSVGDASFQKKSLGKVKDVAKGGRTVLFVSHNMNAISQLCTRCLVIDSGKIVFDGLPKQAIAFYLKTQEKYFGERVFRKDTKKDVQIRKVKILNKGKKPSAALDIGKPIEVVIEYQIRKIFPNLALTAEMLMANGSLALATEDRDLKNKMVRRKRGIYKTSFTIPQDRINKGQYFLRILIKNISQREKQDEIIDEQEVLQFECIDKKGRVKRSTTGAIAPLFKWKTESI
jgi:lipopolysaccharide transport system ATP-binding protein